jgi:uncharacterized membrane protein
MKYLIGFFMTYAPYKNLGVTLLISHFLFGIQTFNINKINT